MPIPFSLLFTICTKRISFLGQIDDSKDILCRMGVQMWISSSLVSKAIKAVTKRDEKKRKEDVETVWERKDPALMQAQCGSGVQMTCAYRAD